MRIKGKALRLIDLGEMNYKAKASWDYFGFDQVMDYARSMAGGQCRVLLMQL